MEESTTKDNTPASSPSPHNFRRKQLFASEENLSSRSTKGPEETGRTSPSHAFSGSASLETFKSMTLPSYKLLSSEEYLEASVPPTVEIIKETKKTDHKKSALLSLVTGKKEAVKTIDAENIPDRTLQDEENKIPEEKSEQEAKHLELPADLSRGKSSEDGHRAEDVFANKQPLNPFEEERKPEKAAAPAKTKAVKPRSVVFASEVDINSDVQRWWQAVTRLLPATEQRFSTWHPACGRSVLLCRVPGGFKLAVGPFNNK